MSDWHTTPRWASLAYFRASGLQACTACIDGLITAFPSRQLAYGLSIFNLLRTDAEQNTILLGLLDIVEVGQLDSKSLNIAVTNRKLLSSFLGGSTAFSIFSSSGLGNAFRIFQGVSKKC